MLMHLGDGQRGAVAHRGFNLTDAEVQFVFESASIRDEGIPTLLEFDQKYHIDTINNNLLALLQSLLHTTIFPTIKNYQLYLLLEISITVS
ncbi:hypothetical protein PAECIP111892_05584 [Paenibacillus auburnensis]|uniref:Uncharacterized protein n=1 Tax=Paenibacillus auburnensis TaxID=2905649 RepID=A0ABM9CXD3_9BACL|nr:hypothetical protein [Paenibacillus auburnensis]CAH1225236.1 hypothetical protein PAECIP111892_05584 [Paenibacillus auburnensis]